MVKGSHNPDRPSFRGSTRVEYSAFYSRIESEFEPSEMSLENVSDWLNSDTNPFIDILVRIKEINDTIEVSQDLDELRDLKSEISTIPVHRANLREKLSDRIKSLEKEEKIAISIATIENFAEERGINLSENVIGKIETWKDGNDYFVIRERGHFRAWQRVE